MLVTLVLNSRATKIVVTIVILLFTTSSLSQICVAQNYERSFFILKDGISYELTLSITHTLHEYYVEKDHILTMDNFDTFVTPYSLALVAEDIRSIHSDEEDFVNAVLTLVHQIPYEIVDQAEYPVETIVENRGDCDLLSFIAASLLDSQGFDVVLLYYEQELHMNIGVSLSSSPQDARTTATYVSYDGTRYYIAECTGEDWEDGWRVGECPPQLEQAHPTVVLLDNCERIAPGQVSSSFGALEGAAISITVSSSFVMEGTPVTVTGRVAVQDPEGIVTLYVEGDRGWSVAGTTELDANGRFSFSWNPRSWGQHHIKASWSGDEEHAGADSVVVSVYVLPKMLIYACGGFLILTIVAVILYLIHKSTHQEPQILETNF